VGEFVGDQLIAAERSGLILPGGENDVVPDGVSQGVDGAGGFAGGGIGVHADIAEIVAQSRLEKRAAGAGKRRARAGDNAMNDGGCR
jgi:hypothetical protein